MFRLVTSNTRGQLILRAASATARSTASTRHLFASANIVPALASSQDHQSAGGDWGTKTWSVAAALAALGGLTLLDQHEVSEVGT